MISFINTIHSAKPQRSAQRGAKCKHNNNNNVYTKTEVDQKIAEAGGGCSVPDPLSIDTIKVNKYIGNCDTFIHVGLDVSRATHNSVSISAASAEISGSNSTFTSANIYGGDYPRFMARNSHFSGGLIIGGEQSCISLNNNYQSALIVGSDHTIELLDPNDAAMSIGGPDGLRVFYSKADETKTLMYMNGKLVNIQYSQTITHEAPFTGSATEYTIGDPQCCARGAS